MLYHDHTHTVCILNFNLTCQAIRSFSFSIFSRSSGCSCMYLSLKKAWRGGRRNTGVSMLAGGGVSSGEETIWNVCVWIYEKREEKTDESRRKALGGAVQMRKISSRHPLSSTTCTISLRWRSDLRAKNSRRSSSDSYCTVSQDQYESIPGRDIYAGKPTGYHFFYHLTQGKKEFPFPHESLLSCSEQSVKLTNTVRTLEMWWKTGHKEDWVEPFERK